MLFVKHKKFVDVCIKVYGIMETKHREIGISGTYWNLGQTESFSIDVPANLIIEKQNFNDNWLFCEINDDPKIMMGSLRKEVWR